ncbi:MAG: SinI family restriction endonuclease [Rhodoglobus sp.]
MNQTPRNPFVPYSQRIAFEFASQSFSSEVATDYAQVVGFMAANPETARQYRSVETGSETYIRKLALIYGNARYPKLPSRPKTIPDPAVGMVLNAYFDIGLDQLDRIKAEHLLSMAAENVVGDLLERYIADNIETSGWVWCAGGFVKAIDFIRPKINQDGHWESLQVKNRDNSENSSSSKVRVGTTIEKWYRTKAATGETFWGRFPANSPSQMSETGFLAFISSHLAATLRSSGQN